MNATLNPLRHRNRRPLTLRRALRLMAEPFIVAGVVLASAAVVATAEIGCTEEAAPCLAPTPLSREQVTMAKRIEGSDEFGFLAPALRRNMLDTARAAEIMGL